MIRRLAYTAFAAALVLGTEGLRAHPMPDTEIVVTREAASVEFEVRIPLDDLMLVLPDLDAAAPLSDSARSQIAEYLGAHLRLEEASGAGAAVAVTIDMVRLQKGTDSHVGEYREVEIGARAASVAEGPLTLRYDAVLHQVANHRALVRLSDGSPIGIIRFSLAEKRATPLTLPGRAH